MELLRQLQLVTGDVDAGHLEPALVQGAREAPEAAPHVQDRGPQGEIRQVEQRGHLPVGGSKAPRARQASM